MRVFQQTWIALAVATFLPVVGVVVLCVLRSLELLPPAPDGFSLSMYYVVVAFMCYLLFLIVLYVCMILTHKGATRRWMAMWLVLLGLFHIIAFPVYWSLYPRPRRLADREHEEALHA